MRKIIKIISFKKKFGLFESSRLVAPLHSSSHNFLLELLKTNAPSLQAFKWKRRIGERILSFHFKLDRPSREATLLIRMCCLAEVESRLEPTSRHRRTEDRAVRGSLRIIHSTLPTYEFLWWSNFVYL